MLDLSFAQKIVILFYNAFEVVLITSLLLISVAGMNFSTIFYLIASMLLTHLLNSGHHIARKILIVKIVFGVSVLLIIVKESLTYSDATIPI